MIKLKLNEMSTNHLQTYYTLVEIAGAIFGSDKKKPVVVNDMAPEAAVAGLNRLFEAAGR